MVLAMAHGAAVLPNVAEVLAAVLARVPRERQPLLIAYAERLAADRYRGWAAQAENQRRRPGLLACAEREEAIATRIESLHPGAAAIQQAILAANPDLEQVNRTLFEGRPLAQQFAIQAQGERLGAATWRAFAAQADESARSTLFECAALEEESAVFLEGILAALEP
jgi:hypothetical protein